MADGLGVVAGVELLEAELHRGLCGPEAQRVDRLAAVADDRGVVGHSVDLLGRDPLEDVASVLAQDLDLAAEVEELVDGLAAALEPARERDYLRRVRRDPAKERALVRRRQRRDLPVKTRQFHTLSVPVSFANAANAPEKSPYAMDT